MAEITYSSNNLGNNRSSIWSYTACQSCQIFNCTSEIEYSIFKMLFRTSWVILYFCNECLVNLLNPCLPPVLQHPTDDEAYGLPALEAPADVLVPVLLAGFAQAPHHRILWQGVQDRQVGKENYQNIGIPLRSTMMQINLWLFYRTTYQQTTKFTFNLY